MEMIRGLVERLRKRADLRPAGEGSSQVTDASLREFWSLCDGMQDNPDGLPARLLGQDESAEHSAALLDLRWPPCLAFAYDMGGNFAVVLTGGDLAGFVSVWDHEEPVPAPHFSTLETFLCAYLAKSDAIDLCELDREYPRVQPADAATANRELQLFKHRRDQWLKKGIQIDAWVALALTPPQDPSHLTPFLECNDMWICEEACRVMARVHPRSAIPVLERLAVQGMKPNVPSGCLAELRRLGTPEAVAALKRLRPILSEYSDRFFEV